MPKVSTLGGVSGQKHLTLTVSASLSIQERVNNQNNPGNFLRRCKVSRMSRKCLVIKEKGKDPVPVMSFHAYSKTTDRKDVS